MSQSERAFVDLNDSGNESATHDAEIDKNLGQIVRHLIIKEEILEPVIFRKFHQDWEPCTWSLAEWGALFKNEKMSMRYGKKNWNKKCPQWESECGKIDLTWRELLDWMNGQFVFLNKDGSPDDIWIYYDYKYLPDVFHIKSPDEKDFLKLIYFIENLKNKFCWSKLGFPERNGDQTTLWIGTAGAYTPGHFDTYSCNLVCQVYGTKTWLLFPPRDTQHLHPTRIPYEESSVYSRINFSSSKEICAHLDDLRQCSPVRVTLEPGDCLFVPPKWWHFVKSEDFSISVNTWIELPGDHSIRMEEAILRSIVASVVNVTYPETATKLLNPNEMDLTDFNESDLNDLLQQTTTACLHDSKIPQPCSSKDMNNDEAHSFTITTTNDKTGIIDTNSTATQCVRDCPNSQDEPLRKVAKRSYRMAFDELLARSSAIERLPTYNFEDFVSKDNTECKLLMDKAADLGVAVNEEKDGEEAQNVTVTNDKCDQEENEDSAPTYLDHLINAIGHPEVLKHISAQLLKNVALQPPSNDKKKF